MPRKSVTAHARALAALGSSKGGVARFAGLNLEERRQIARKAALGRWGAAAKTTLHSVREGELSVGELRIPCAVLENGKRVVSERGIARALIGDKPRRRRVSQTGSRLTSYLSDGRLKPFIATHLEARLKKPLVFRSLDGSAVQARSASLLLQVCDVWLNAHRAGVLGSRQLRVARNAEQLKNDFERVGVAAVIDRVTHYAEIVARKELVGKLRSHLSAERIKWLERFPDAFFAELYRVQGWAYEPGTSIDISDVVELLHTVFGRLAPSTMSEFELSGPHQSQSLIAETGNSALDLQVTIATTILRLSDDKASLAKNLEKAFLSKPAGERTADTPIGTRPLRAVNLRH